MGISLVISEIAKARMCTEDKKRRRCDISMMMHMRNIDQVLTEDGKNVDLGMWVNI